jgi:NAD(P)-dependent dehydrogenase (short-subunit alcohol dehydrogenase family)
MILGVRDTAKVQATLDAFQYNKENHKFTLFPLDLTKVQNVKTFANQALERLGSNGKIDYLLLNAGMSKDAKETGFHHKWCETYVVNHLSQHYLMHLLQDKLIASKSRVVFVSSGAIRGVTDTSMFNHLKCSFF